MQKRRLNINIANSVIFRAYTKSKIWPKWGLVDSFINSSVKVYDIITIILITLPQTFIFLRTCFRLYIKTTMGPNININQRLIVKIK